MVRNFDTVPSVKQELKSITCDVCQTSYTNVMQLQEFHYVDFIGGYESVFGDGVRMQADICQRCLKTLLGKYLRDVTELER